MAYVHRKMDTNKNFFLPPLFLLLVSQLKWTTWILFKLEGFAIFLFKIFTSISQPHIYATFCFTLLGERISCPLLANIKLGV